MRVLLALTMMIALLLPATAQDDAAPWQATVTGQIEAFRSGDGAAALTFAAKGFRTQFEGQPDAFYAAIIATGYQPIVDSRSHSFGEFNKVSETIVMQVVKFVGPDQGLYEALYQLGDEPDEGWRVLGVALKKEEGVGI
ncbi:DUF4864 domain-containing protein [Devosia sp. SL43]|uniref:DUF4864 domain-containing protein n=1 Tax=Devosia sp. SL43 TaxID=2806348 RepID=UPI001F32A877|nr:DUF4864 domain-containing protein [Devosia sp. SL43]UJW86796.1 DUF4864 domain-containing protein [Devosia sp. SL43]